MKEWYHRRSCGSEGGPVLQLRYTVRIPLRNSATTVRIEGQLLSQMILTTGKSRRRRQICCNIEAVTSG